MIKCGFFQDKVAIIMSIVAVVGAGPAGLLAAAYAAKKGHTVVLFEKNEKTGKKLYITGKGRCNITNIDEKREFMEHVPRNPKFLFSAFARFFNQDIIDLLQSQGVPTKIERGGRVFPTSDKSSDVTRALTVFAESQGVKIRLNAKVKKITPTDEGGFLIHVDDENRHYDAVVLATGGASYTATGSTGDGYAFARALGHTIIDPKPSLIHLITHEKWASELQGLSLKNVTLRALRGKKSLYESLGEMLFTHNGVSGPLVLSASSQVADNPEGVKLEIDLKPGLNMEELDARVLRDFSKYQAKQVKNAMVELLPQRLIPIVLRLSSIDGEKTVDKLSRGERQAIVSTLKCLPLTVKHAGPIVEAVITRGGVSVKEIDSATMQSKLMPGLFFAGEVIDVDAHTGGYNLQIAYSTGVLAGCSI